MKPEELKTLQLKRLKKTLSQVQNVEFYRNLLSGAGVKASSIKTLDDIQKIPFTKKQDLSERVPVRFFCSPHEKNCPYPYNFRNHGKANSGGVYPKRPGYMVRSHSQKHDHGWSW